MRSICVYLLAGAVGWPLASHFAAAEAAGTKEKVVYSFCNQANCTDGSYPVAGLIDVNGTLYGTTDEGGAYNSGTVFSLGAKTGSETLLYSFGGGTDGAYPVGNLIRVKGTLYGTTYGGGGNKGCHNSYGCGTVFSFDLSTDTETVLYRFCSQRYCTDGVYPEAGLIDVKGTLYGTTFYGGSINNNDYCGNGCGTVFALDPKTGTETVLYSFCSQDYCADGADPEAGLIDVDGTLYGTTSGGGQGPYGTVFSLDPNTGSETVLHSFWQGNDGLVPEAGLIDVNGTLYGTTALGGVNYCSNGGSCGTVFSLDLATGQESVVYSFCSEQNCADGASPLAALINVSSDGTLYGTTSQGGGTGCGGYPYGCGTAFALDPSTGAASVLHAFCSQENCTDGANPQASMIYRNGKLYGTTPYGGANCQSSGGCGTVFVLKRP